MSPLRRHNSFDSWQNRLFGGVFRPQLSKNGSDPDNAWMKYVVCFHLYIPWKFGERGSTPRGAKRPSLSFFCLFVFLSVRHATMLGTEIYALNLGGTGISPPDCFSFRSRFRSRYSSSYTTSGDIFYCSGSRQLNHSSLVFILFTSGDTYTVVNSCIFNSFLITKVC